MIKTFPYLEVTGTNYDVGTAIGEMFRGKIQETIKDRHSRIRHYADKLVACEPYFHATKQAFPDLTNELKGMADGANVSLLDLFFHNTPEVYDHTLEWDREQAQTEDHCTIAVSFNNNGPIIGHNEDWAIESLDELYVLKATIDKTTFLGLNYASYLAGSSATMNNWGIVQCINELHQTAKIGVVKYFLARAVLSCKTLEEVETILTKTKRASGYNHLFVQNNRVWDVEIAGEEMDFEKNINKPYVHTNHCISQKMQKYQMSATKSSLARYQRASEIVMDNMSIEEMEALLSDTQNQNYPICQENMTIASVIIEPNKQTLHICYGAPCKGGVYVPYSL